MSKKREVNKELHYKNIINKQKKVIQKLAKKAGRGEKLEDRFFDIEDQETELLLQEEEKPQNKGLSCPTCGSPLDTIAGEKITVFLCTGCKYRASKRN